MTRATRTRDRPPLPSAAGGDDARGGPTPHRECVLIVGALLRVDVDLIMPTSRPSSIFFASKK